MRYFAKIIASSDFSSGEAADEPRYFGSAWDDSLQPAFAADGPVLPRQRDILVLRSVAVKRQAATRPSDALPST